MEKNTLTQWNEEKRDGFDSLVFKDKEQSFQQIKQDDWDKFMAPAKV